MKKKFSWKYFKFYSINKIDRLPLKVPFDSDWKITRNSENVGFGCGAVIVSRKDLIDLAFSEEDSKKHEKALQNLASAWYKNSFSQYYQALEAVKKIDKQTLLNIAG